MSPVEIKKDRIDLTKYIFHFTHRNELLSSFEVLKSIVSDGVLKSGWAERNFKRTVFGTKPAVCFSESPLYAHLDYVIKRNYKDKVDFYGIAFLKADMFNKFKARPIIYGMSTYKEEKIHPSAEYYFIDGLPDEEQYRYMLSAINEKNDWTHEREWRWCDLEDKSKLFGLPVWKNSNYDEMFDSDDYFLFDQIIIVVRSMGEAEMLLAVFATKVDKTVHNLRNVKNTWIYVLPDDSIKLCATSSDYLRIDDIVVNTDAISVRQHLGLEL